MTSLEYLARRKHLRETIERAIRYHHENPAGCGIRSAVESACGTMLFDATEAEMSEMIEAVIRSETPERRRSRIFR